MYRVPFLSLERQHQSIERKLKGAILKTIQSGRFVSGDEVNSFEDEFAAYQKTRYCAAVGNGHDAILISLKALGIGRGDEVIVPSHTCQATWLAVLNAGAKPVPAEVDPMTYNIDPLQIENVITPRTRAIVPVHLYGHPCVMDRIIAIAKKDNLFVAEDNAQAQGATFKNKMTGSWGHCNATSFYPTKNLGALGDGGAIVTNDKRAYQFARAFRNYGSEKRDEHVIAGVNSRLDELQAAVLRIKLRKLEEWNRKRRQNATSYLRELYNVEDIQLPPGESEVVRPVFHLFVIQTTHRAKLKKFLEKKGIETAIHYPVAVHLQKAFGHLGYKKGSLPIAEKLSNEVLSLPIWPGLKKEEIEKVCGEIRNYFK